MPAPRRWLLLGVLLACVACTDRTTLDDGGPPGPGGFDESFGHGAFGAWVNDDFGLPAYRYTGCTTSTCSEPEDVFHQLGNDAVTAVAHGDGRVELFTAKTFYRFANRYDPESGNYAGGFGWVRDGEETWSTFHEDRPSAASYERLFGMGYYKKTIEHAGLRIEHWIYPAPGGDEVLLERIVFTNPSSTDKSIEYFDYWDVGWWLLRHRDPINSLSDWDPATVETIYDRSRATIKAVSRAAAGDLDRPRLTADPSPKVSFVTLLGDEPDAFDTVQAEFVGRGNRAIPGRVREGRLGNSVDASGTLRNQDAVLVTQKGFSLAPGDSRTLHVLYGLAPRGEEDRLIDRYRDGPADLLSDVMRSFARRLVRLDLPEAPWIAREMAWSHYYLLSAMLREEFFATRVINQGSIYQYLWGANAGPRASLRHLLPLIYSEPEAAREVLVYELRAMRPTGELSYATAGYGALHSMGFLPSDGALWLFWAASEYVHATRDHAFLDEIQPFYCEERRGACGDATAYDMLVAAWHHQVEVTGTGPHGLVRLLKSDWDDVLVGPDATATRELGESTMNTALALVAYPRLAALAEQRGDAAFAESVRQVASELREAMRNQWRGEFFNRAYLYDATRSAVEVGAENLWLASNGIALIAGGLLETSQVERLVRRIRSDNLDPSPVGLASQGAPVTAGVGASGSWHSLSGPTIEGLLAHPESSDARALAWSAFQRLTLANHATRYPQYWYGIWSGPDMYFTPVESEVAMASPGDTWCFPGVICMRDFPVTNMFAHSEPLLASLRLAGVRVDERGHSIDPGFPFPEFRWESGSYGVTYTESSASGRIRSLGDDTIQMRVRLPEALADSGAAVHVEIDGRGVPAEITDGFAVFEATLRAGVQTGWSVR